LINFDLPEKAYQLDTGLRGYEACAEPQLSWHDQAIQLY